MYCVVCQVEVSFAAVDTDADHRELLCGGCGTAIMATPAAVWAERPDGPWNTPQQRRTA